MNNIDSLLAYVPEGQREQAKQAIPAIVKSLEEEGILTPKVLAYAMATVSHESGFEPKEEILAQRGKNERNDYIASLQDNYEGGTAFRGRGYIQLTHKGNYEKYGKRIGEDLTKNPEKLLTPEVSAKVLAAYFKDTGVADAVEQGDYNRARVLIQGRGALNPQFAQNTQNIANQAKSLERITPKVVSRTPEISMSSLEVPEKPIQEIERQLFTPSVSGSVQIASSPARPSFLPQQMSEGMVKPIAFFPIPGVEMPNTLQLPSERTRDTTTLPAPSFNIGSIPETKISSAQPFSPGVSEQVGKITQGFTDIVKQAFSPPQEKEGVIKQDQSQQSIPSPQPDYSQAQASYQKQKTTPFSHPKQLASVQPQTSFSPSGTSSVKLASPVTKVGNPQTYVVKKGDTLSGIAQKTLGSAAQWKSLQGYSGNPRKLPVGTRITIPRPR